ncbi:Uma2 family endonuclease [Kitasatospora aureofaciens]|uniref:Uma2 family endonuclease n=1 Tax=Kitasatospora aureofaciens TaxID=1894 RepID=UPI001C45C6EF|nr:Uma2 family endonuclease [Kitasatospora aureofaciens]MBV6696548.1 Uma2 family endonuclease [Kitasatospora aureofaciens]
MSTDPAVYARLREIADQLPQVPGAGKVEIADGKILMMLSPVLRHELAVARTAEQLNAQLPQTHPGYIAHGGADLEDAGLGRLRNPDLMVFAEASLEGEEPALLPHEVVLVVEIVSKSDPENDYRDKVRDYTAMGIPLYLIIDPRTGTGIVHSEPGYASRETFVFGDTITVGPWTLDTGVLRTYA